jgi:hypothetical protein
MFIADYYHLLFNQPFPWHIVHRIDKHSPLYNQSHISLENSEAEIICLIEGTDELTSLNFQARWSYLPHEILWGHRFVDCLSKDRRGKFQIDFSKISRRYRPSYFSVVVVSSILNVTHMHVNV